MISLDEAVGHVRSLMPQGYLTTREEQLVRAIFATFLSLLENMQNKEIV